jgi:hypothetical protein
MRELPDRLGRRSLRSTIRRSCWPSRRPGRGGGPADASTERGGGRAAESRGCEGWTRCRTRFKHPDAITATRTRCTNPDAMTARRRLSSFLTVWGEKRESVRTPTTTLFDLPTSAVRKLGFRLSPGDASQFVYLRARPIIIRSRWLCDPGRETAPQPRNRESCPFGGDQPCGAGMRPWRRCFAHGRRSPATTGVSTSQPSLLSKSTLVLKSLGRAPNGY